MIPRVSCIIPARIGSKRIPKKNIKLLCGKPLIWYTIDAAMKSKYITDLYISTESDEIKNIAEKYGVSVIDRTPALANDVTLTEEVIKSAIKHIRSCDYLAVLYATSPLRRSSDIDKLIEKVLSLRADSGQTISAVKRRVGKRKGDFFTYEQGSMNLDTRFINPIFMENSGAYVFRPTVLTETGRMQGRQHVGSIIEPPFDLDINEMYEWHLAEALLEKGIV